jgi:8-oxo-dGTP diphosphatase
MQEYVLGFAYDTDNRQVLLINKTKPVWQAGKLNGVGGKIERGESGHVAMVREFREETGVPTWQTDWKLFCRLSVGDDAVVYCFSTTAHIVRNAKQIEEERPEWVSYSRPLPDRCLPNLHWLIPMGLADDLVFAEAKEIMAH